MEAHRLVVLCLVPKGNPDAVSGVGADGERLNRVALKTEGDCRRGEEFIALASLRILFLLCPHSVQLVR